MFFLLPVLWPKQLRLSSLISVKGESACFSFVHWLFIFVLKSAITHLWELLKKCSIDSNYLLGMYVSNILSHTTFLLMALFTWKHIFHLHKIISCVLGCVLCLRSYISFCLLSWKFCRFGFFRLNFDLTRTDFFLYICSEKMERCFLLYSIIEITDIQLSVWWQINNFGDQCTPQNRFIWPLGWLLEKTTINTGLAHTSCPLVKAIYVFGGDWHCELSGSARKKAAQRTLLLPERLSNGHSRAAFVRFTLGPVTPSPPPLLPEAQGDTQASTLWTLRELHPVWMKVIKIVFLPLIHHPLSPPQAHLGRG